MTPELEAYIENHIEEEPEYLHRIERATNLQRINGRMCSGHIQGRLLKMLTKMINPGKALELGTFTGYSAICIAEGLADGAKLVTVEADDELEEVINQNFRMAGYSGVIDLRIGAALDICRELPDESFQMIFIDADKREYPAYLVEAKRLLAPGGYIIADNILWDGHVAEPGRNDPQTAGVKEFNRMAAEDPDFTTIILPVRDGLSIIRKNEANENRGSDVIK